MLKEEAVLDSIVAARLTGNTIWDDIPVYGLRRGIDTYDHEPNVIPEYSTQIEILKDILSNTKASTILCQYGTMAVLFASLLEFVPQKLFIHVHGKDTHEHMHRPEYRHTFERLARRSTIICTPHVYERIVQWHIPRTHLVIKNYGVEIPAEPILRLKNYDVNVLHVGRLIDCKGPDRTIQAFDLACDLGLQGQLILVGDGPLRDVCEEMRACSKWQCRIHMLGSMAYQGVTKKLADADIFTLHSMVGERSGQIEAFGVAVVEAMAFALPVVSCSIGGVKQIVVDGETGIMIEPNDVESQARAFIKLAQEPELRTQMGLAGWRRAREYYSYENEKHLLLSILGM